MRDATNITERKFHINGVETIATNTWITDNNEVYISLKHPRGGEMNVHVKDIGKYTVKKEGGK